MIRNIGTNERAIRVTVALVILGLGWYYQSLWGVVGLIPLFTGVFGWCPLYKLVGKSTHSGYDGDESKL